MSGFDLSKPLYEEGWEQKGKHIFVLSSSGKPIFSRYGDEQDIASTFGLLQALVSVVQDQGDNLRCIKAGRRRIVYFIRQSLYFICVSSGGEPEAVLAKQLEFMYNQVLLILTDQVHRILAEDSAKDLRDLLGSDTTRLMHNACRAELVPPCIAFHAVQGFVMDAALRKDVLARLDSCVRSSGAALGILLSGDSLVGYHSNEETALNLTTADMLLLAHFVGNSSSLRSHDQNWVPICLPQFNAGAILQAYICNLRLASDEGHISRCIDVSLILVSVSADPAMFKDLHDGRQRLEANLGEGRLPARLLEALDVQARALRKPLDVYGCLHCFYKVRPAGEAENRAVPAQCLSSVMDFPLDALESQEAIWCQYERIALCLRSGSSTAEVTLLPGGGGGSVGSATSDAGAEKNLMTCSPSSDHALAYVRLNSGYVVVGLATFDTELYATFSDCAGAMEACGFANHLSRQLKIDTANDNLFQMR